MMQELFPVVGRPSLHQMMKKILIKSSQRPKCFCSSFCFLYLVQFSFLPSVLNNSLVWSAETEEVCSCHVKLFKHTAEAICCLAQRRDFVSAWGLSSLSSDRVTTRKLCCVKPLNIHWMCSFGAAQVHIILDLWKHQRPNLSWEKICLWLCTDRRGNFEVAGINHVIEAFHSVLFLDSHRDGYQYQSPNQFSHRVNEVPCRLHIFLIIKLF